MNTSSSHNSSPSFLSSHSVFGFTLSPVLKELIERGYIYQCTDPDGLNSILSANLGDSATGGENKSNDHSKHSVPISCYVGFDCTAKSLHVGSLMQIMIMRAMQRHGYRPVILLGGATTRIGDPSDKDEMRKLRSLEEIEENKLSIAKIFRKLLVFEGECAAILVDNSDWLSEQKYLDFLQDYGRHFSINRMLTFDSVKLRLERQHPLTFLEFNYMLLQAYDFVELYRRYNCCLQFGGSEQWGNIVSGVDLARRVEGCELFGITTPLITTANGAKMGKTVGGAVWLNDDMLSSYEFWQFWRNVADADVIRFLKIYTNLKVEEIDRAQENLDINELKVMLANEVTSLCHDKEAAGNAERTARETFSGGGIGSDLPKVEISSSDLPMPFYRLLVTCGLCESNSAAKKLIVGKGVRIDNEMIDDENHIVSMDTFVSERDMVKISVGKKRHIVIMLMR